MRYDENDFEGFQYNPPNLHTHTQCVQRRAVRAAALVHVGAARNQRAHIFQQPGLRRAVQAPAGHRGRAEGVTEDAARAGRPGALSWCTGF